MALNYGATGESHMNAASYNLDTAEDVDYDYLPLPEVDESFLDPLDGKQIATEGWLYQMYMNVSAF